MKFLISELSIFQRHSPLDVTNVDRTVDAADGAIEQEEENTNEAVEVAKDESESTESVQVHSIKTANTSEIHNTSLQINIGPFDTQFSLITHHENKIVSLQIIIVNPYIMDPKF